MNSFLAVFAAILITVNGGSLRSKRQGGWGVPQSPTVLDIGLTGNAAAGGSAGSADATQILTASATGGWAGSPAIVDVGGYTNAALGQDVGLTQVTSVELSPPGPITSTLNVASVDNYAFGDEGIGAYLEGVSTSLSSVASDNASGIGTISAFANTLNTQSG